MFILPHLKGLTAGNLGSAVFKNAGLDLKFADNKSLVDSISGNNLISFTRAGSAANAATYVGSDGVLRSATTNEPRFDHNPTTGESLGLLVEEARTNSVTNNTMVGAVAGTPGTLPTSWGSFTSPTGLTRTVVGSGTVNGINYIDVRFNGTPSSTGEITLYLSPTTTAASLGQSWTASAWLSLTGGSTSNIATVALRNFELNSGAYVRETSTNFVSSISSDFIRRQNVTSSFGASANQIQSVLSINATAGGTPIDFTLRIGLPQLEQGAFATSVIPTTTATVTRAADVASITGSNFSSFYNQTEGTWFAQHDVRNMILSANNNTFSERQPQMGLGAGLAHDFYSITGGVIQANSIGGAHVIGTPDRVVYAMKANDFIGALNGTLFGADTSGSFGSLITQLNIGSLHNGASISNGTIKRLVYWGQRLPNNVLQAITQ